MFPPFTFKRTGLSKDAGRLASLKGIAFLSVVIMVVICRCEAQAVEVGNAGDLGRRESSLVVSNIAQFRSEPREVFLGRCAFQLNGIVTLVDTNRGLLVLQDKTGAVGLNPKAGLQGFVVQVGQRVVVEGSRCFPYVVGFPNYPYRSSGREVRTSFEGPENFGDYYLTRMRGHLHPPVTGEYTFWIASDNSSELWLSSNDDPTNVKKIAFMARYSWVAPREWSRYPSQRSENIYLEAGRRYYIEAFQEQTTGGDHLSAAWQGPSVSQSVIANRYLTPWIENRDQVSLAATNGVLREYWTNFSLGGLATLTAPRAFESSLSVDEMQVTSQGAEAWPEPRPITWNQPLLAEDNYRWVEARGEVVFTGTDGGVGFLELSDGEVQLQVRVSHCDPESLRRFHNSSVRVEGVCEGVYDPKGVLVPRMIWVSKENNISLIETTKTNLASIASGQSSRLVFTNSNP